MTSLLEQEILELRKIIERHTFQIKILQKLAANYDRFGIFDQVLAYDLNEEVFNELRALTDLYEQKIESDLKENIKLKDFSTKFIQILKDNDLIQDKSEADINRFIFIWLKGPEGGFGFSKNLHTYFYEDENKRH